MLTEQLKTLYERTLRHIADRGCRPEDAPTVAAKALDWHHSEPAAKTELTAEEQDFRDYIASVPNLTMGDAERILRLLDEHAAMRTELERLRSTVERVEKLLRRMNGSMVWPGDLTDALHPELIPEPAL